MKITPKNCWWVVVVLMTVTPPLHAGKIYKWTDAEGNVHFGDRPPHDQAESIAPAPAPKPDPKGAAFRERQRKALRAMEEERQKKREATQQARTEKEERQQQCEAARKELLRLQNARYLYEEELAGERRIFSAEEREDAVANARARVDELCN